MIALLRRSVCGGGVDGGWCCFVCVGVDDGGVQNANGKTGCGQRKTPEHAAAAVIKTNKKTEQTRIENARVLNQILNLIPINAAARLSYVLNNVPHIIRAQRNCLIYSVCVCVHI